jgi:hypothetical protein
MTGSQHRDGFNRNRFLGYEHRQSPEYVCDKTGDTGFSAMTLLFASPEHKSAVKEGTATKRD